jgi:hypothetical protein
MIPQRKELYRTKYHKKRFISKKKRGGHRLRKYEETLFNRFSQEKFVSLAPKPRKKDLSLMKTFFLVRID